MKTTTIKNIIHNNRTDIAFVIGNGINRYPNNPNALSWEDLLIELWHQVSLHTLSIRPEGISTTEFYDILELENVKDLNLQKKVTNLLTDWEPLTHHQLITEKIADLNAPLLTTNFEDTMSKTINCELFKIDDTSFTDFYPWSTYHGLEKLESPISGFGIWYINGMINYHRSIRLGLGHYMGSVERARNLIHRGKDGRLYSGKNAELWNGYKTWLHIIFNKSLFIFGLDLGENETFLRWLLIERFRYFKKFPNRKHKGWYLYKRNEKPISQGKKFFLERVGFEVIDVEEYEDLYVKIWE
ncbi:hypothetical protein SAMN05443634_10644 [Chishuiella changwenlii]|uniref:SIR2-like domain-containing protein n=1 Tax=Chishuiella changwenlii TaxID=1434701 RepID=A0A1M6Y1G7_9FLAO|nr:hypothetical protein [Chishuiella changwenlii]GGE93857.1 hypothetical protein GCM10010984_09370 [Chishuiella changwenlii]SHL11963.1 hypothetical protein SAMN05443634_10644 [Chishuiella changwenlii]